MPMANNARLAGSERGKINKKEREREEEKEKRGEQSEARAFESVDLDGEGWRAHRIYR